MFRYEGDLVVPVDVSSVLGTGHIHDDAIRAFHDVLARHTAYRPRVFDFIFFPENFQPVPEGQPHLQVVYREPIGGTLSDVGHWVSVYYDGRQINIYDSLGYNNLSPLQLKFLSSLFPYKPPISYKIVQRQNDSIFCGLFATAFTTSLALNRDPCSERYVVEQMRPHLATILRQGVLLPFPVQSDPPPFPATPSQSHSVSKQEKVDKKREKEREKKRRQRARASQNKNSVSLRIPSFSPTTSPLAKKKLLSKQSPLQDLQVAQPTFSTQSSLSTPPGSGVLNKGIISSFSSLFPREVGTLKVPGQSLNSRNKEPSTIKTFKEICPTTTSHFSPMTTRQKARESAKALIINEKLQGNEKNLRKLHDTIKKSSQSQPRKYRSKEALRKTLARSNPAVRGKEQKTNTAAHKLKRTLNPTFRAAETHLNTLAHRRSRNNFELRQSEQKRNSQAHQKARLDLDYRESERLRDSQAHREARLDLDYRESEQVRNSQAHREARLDSDYRESEQIRDSKAHREARLDSDYRESERVRDSEAHREARLDSDFRESERVRDCHARTKARLNLESRNIERVRDSESRRSVRLDPNHVVREHSQRQLCDKANKSSWKAVTDKYFLNIGDGYSHSCCCCGRLFHKKSVLVLKKESLVSNIPLVPDNFFSDVFHLFPSAESGEFCRTCALYVRKGKIPKLARCNGLLFPPIPDALKELNPLEERLVSPRHVFLKIVRKGHGLGYQHGLVGNVVNVPVEVDTMVSALPRSSSDNHIITVELKRKLCYRHGRKERVRPHKVRQAAQYLVQTDLFKDLGISLNENWDVEEDIDESQPCNCNYGNVDQEDNREEEEEHLNPGGQETLLDTDLTLVMAPGEGKRPLSLVHDEHLEELAFINVHCGERRKFKVKLSHLDICKSEISRSDRRAVRPDYLFTAIKKEQVIAIQNKITTCLRKKTSNGAPILVENLLDDSFVNNLIQHDEGYQVLKSIRNSPAHWESEKKKVLAIIRQFGVPTLFLTLSAAETKWDELIKLLKKVLDDECISLEEASALSYAEKARLIQSDPFICATYFEIKLQELRKTWSCSNGPFGDRKIEHFYYRIEFQHRGSPHAHIMLWLEKAPVFIPGNAESMVEVANFVDTIISCESDNLVDSLISLQLHKHTHTCHPKPGRPCRFDIPFFPMPSTQVLVELETTDSSYKEAKETGERIKNALNTMPLNMNTFQEFLDHLNLTYEKYILGIRSTLKKPKIMLKRNPKDIMVNPFCKKIIELHQANMDIQFILDPFACAHYVVNYINKADRGISRLLRSAVEEVRKGNKGVKENLRSICNVFLNSSEISAQEAVYCLVGLPMSRTSESEIFINTSPPGQRVHILRGKQQLADLDPSSTDVFLPNLIDHYSNRPRTEEFNDMTLAEFAAFYTYSKNPKRSSAASEPGDIDIDSGHTTPTDLGNWVALQKNGWIKRRGKPKIIRFRHYNKQQDPENFYRENIMLYLPWRDEDVDLMDSAINYEQVFKDNASLIEPVFSKFNKLGGSLEFENFISAIHEVQNGDDNEDAENATRRRCHPLEGFEEEVQVGDVMNDVVPGGHPGPDQAGDAGAVIAQPPPICEEDLLTMTRILNQEQRDILLHTVHHFQTAASSSRPLFVFVSGGAGVGKSVFIKTLYQCLIHFFNLDPGSNPDEVKVLLCAPTGKAAFGIGGQTVHSALGLPISQAGNVLPELSPSIANTLACKLAKVRLIVIDEISMVGSRTFHQINRRLQQLFRSTDFFGGISLIAVGDFNQLPPVGDNWVFQPNCSNSLGLLAGTALWDSFKLFELKRVMRQQDDLAFATALNNMAVGRMTEADILILQSRTFQSTSLPQVAQGAVHLFTSNREVDCHNERVLSLMTSECAVVNAIDVVSGGPNENAKEKALRSLLSLPTTQTYGLPRAITLRVGARYMMTVNVDTSDGLVNGTTGRLRKIDYGINRGTGERRPLRLWLEFDEELAGRARRRLLGGPELSRLGTDKWTPVESVTYTIKRWKSSNLQVHRTQFPLVAAEAITVHKSQGATMAKVVVHLRPPNKRSVMYVACSRATSASGLFVVSEKGFEPPKPPAITNPVLQEIERLKASPLLPSFKFLGNPPSQKTQTIFHNVQSLRKHEEDVAADYAFCMSSIILLVETWSSVEDAFSRLNGKGFVQVCRTNGSRQSSANHGRGVLAMVKEDLVTTGRVLQSSGQSLTSESAHGHCEAVWMTVDTVVVMAVYKSPRCPPGDLVQLLESAFSTLGYPLPSLVVAGDFNISLCAPNTLVPFFSNYNLRPVLPLTAPTTRANTSIDGLFANFGCEGGLYESFFSYHRPLWFRF